MLVRDRLDVLFEDEEFADLYPCDGRPGFSPGQLALVSVLQFAENLSDRAAADAVRTRIDFKYALVLELEDPGFDYSVLSEFRARLAEGDAADRLLRVMLKRLVEAGLLKPGGRQRTDATRCSRLTETCDTGRPEVVVHVATTIAPVQDGELTEQIHDDLADACLAPAEHVVDAAYVTPARIERARRVHGITLLGPLVPDHSHQANSGGGFDKSAFAVDWDHQQAVCPQGAVSREWRPLRISGHDYIQVKFAKADCLACPDRPQCTTSATRPRALALLPTRELHQIQTRNRLEQQTEDWQRRYAIRAGIEATLSQNVRSCGLRRSRYRGLARTHVQHVLTALACNLTRVADWTAAPPATRRRSTRFRALCTAN
ncbi:MULTISPECIES: transposase [unclassified Streptomyces]|uniref:transposase n=1 Tax=unclassified Streptomyces TaxID=2593676 RepID=UPI00203514B0|nr:MULTISPECIES: transposase [unclassified Streptomyces]